MKTITRIVIVAVAVILVLALPLTRDELRWWVASSRNRAQDYNGYLTSWPTGRHSGEAEKRYDERAWENSSATNTLDSYHNYQQTHPRGKHLEVAQRLIEEFSWRQSTNHNVIAGYQQYLRSFDTGRFVGDARQRIESLVWQQIASSNTVLSYQGYLSNYPNGRFVSNARSQIEVLAWQDATNANTCLSYQAYLSNYVGGRYVAEARSELESLTWQRATNAGAPQHFESYPKAIAALEAYLLQHPAGRHTNEALLRIESLVWQQARNEGTSSNFLNYLGKYRDGKYASLAQARIEELAWQEANKLNTMTGFRTYTTAYPNGRFAQDSQAAYNALRIDERPFWQALEAGTEQQIKSFLRDFPGHIKASEAHEALKDISDGRDIVELVSKKKIEVEVSGAGIQSVIVRFRRLVPYPIKVLVPAGTYFVDGKQSAQNMVTRAKSEVILSSGEWKPAEVLAACANRTRPIPHGEVSFSVQALPSQSELARVVKVLDERVTTFSVVQAAVWIVTDDASLAELEILVSRPAGSLRGGSPVITEADAAWAMRACELAGIDITKKRIWIDKAAILRGALDGNVRTWLEGK